MAGLTAVIRDGFLERLEVDVRGSSGGTCRLDQGPCAAMQPAIDMRAFPPPASNVSRWHNPDVRVWLLLGPLTGVLPTFGVQCPLRALRSGVHDSLKTRGRTLGPLWAAVTCSDSRRSARAVRALLVAAPRGAAHPAVPFPFVFALGLPTLGAECRFTGAYQTFRWHAAKVGS